MRAKVKACQLKDSSAIANALEEINGEESQEVA